MIVHSSLPCQIDLGFWSFLFLFYKSVSSDYYPVFITQLQPVAPTVAPIPIMYFQTFVYLLFAEIESSAIQAGITSVHQSNFPIIINHPKTVNHCDHRTVLSVSLV